MIIAILGGPSGQRMLSIGLSGEDLRQLATQKDACLKVDAARLGLPGWQVIVSSGATDQTLINKLEPTLTEDTEWGEHFAGCNHHPGCEHYPPGRQRTRS